MICYECFARLKVSEEPERICRRCKEQQKLGAYMKGLSGPEEDE